MPYQLHHGDALAVLPTIPDATVDAVITDPPYNSGGLTPKDRRGRTPRDKYVTRQAAHDLADFVGNSRDQRGYLAWLTLLLAEGYRATRPGGSVLVFTDWSQLPVTSDAIQAAGWVWRGIIPWEKPISRPRANGFRRSCEYVLWGSHGEPHRHTPTIYLPGVLRGSQPRGAKRQHITQKPVEVMRELVRIAPAGGTILDPCAGAGTTGVAALEEGRRFIGVEVTGHYAAIARERLDAVQPRQSA
jgi:site-specific DNA-methyltransferase (adenine-specific)